MTRLYLVLAIALVIESFGNIYITKGMKEVGEVQITNVGSLLRAARLGATNPRLLAGVAMLALFFGLFLAMLSWADITVVLPLTSIGYVLTALCAKWMLQEEISLTRWVGTFLIVVGVYFIQKSNHLGPSEPAPPLPANSEARNTSA